MRNISCSLTTEQVRARTKFVTRRLGWKFLKPDTLLRVVEKAMGLKPGEKIVPLAIVRVIYVRRERLRAMICNGNYYGRCEVELEGFPEKTPLQFVDMFCEHMGVGPDQEITRIEWKYESRCLICGFEISKDSTHCGECTCEEDSL